jgi:hypothetical protein
LGIPFRIFWESLSGPWGLPESRVKSHDAIAESHFP